MCSTRGNWRAWGSPIASSPCRPASSPCYRDAREAKIMTPHSRTTRRPAANHGEEGAALVLALILMLVASAVGAALMMLSQTETFASMNYRSMTQARYAAESGVHKASNYLLNA